MIDPRSLVVFAVTVTILGAAAFGWAAITPPRTAPARPSVPLDGQRDAEIHLLEARR